MVRCLLNGSQLEQFTLDAITWYYQFFFLSKLVSRRMGEARLLRHKSRDVSSLCKINCHITYPCFLRFNYRLQYEALLMRFSVWFSKLIDCRNRWPTQRLHIFQRNIFWDVQPNWENIALVDQATPSLFRHRIHGAPKTEVGTTLKYQMQTQLFSSSKYNAWIKLFKRFSGSFSGWSSDM